MRERAKPQRRMGSGTNEEVEKMERDWSDVGAQGHLGWSLVLVLVLALVRVFALVLALVLVLVLEQEKDEHTHNPDGRLGPRHPEADSETDEADEADTADNADIGADMGDTRTGDILAIRWSSASSRCPFPQCGRSWKVDNDPVSASVFVDEKKEHGHGIWADDDDSLVHVRRALETKRRSWAVWAGNRFRGSSTGWRARWSTLAVWMGQGMR